LAATVHLVSGAAAFEGGSPMKCTICGNDHENKCPFIKAYEYYPILDSAGHALVKRVEFVSAADFVQVEDEPLTLPDHDTMQ
jgi:hypothetical protein